MTNLKSKNENISFEYLQRLNNLDRNYQPADSFYIRRNPNLLEKCLQDD